MLEQVVKDSSVWKILTIDNIYSSNKIIELLSKNISFQNKNLSVLSATSLKEGKDILHQNPDITVILIDIMMEGKEKGLEFIEFIRNELKNAEVRIILKTGYPDSLPEKKVIEDYEIDGYIPKEISSQFQIEVIIITAIHNYQQITNTKKLLQSLTGSISHELRTPLATVRGGIEAIKMNLQTAIELANISSDNSNQKNILMNLQDAQESLEFIELCNNVIDQGNMIIDLTLEKIYDKPIDKARFSSTSILETVNQAIKQYAFKNAAEKEKVKIDINKENDFIYFGNKDIMIFVLFNLLKNSLYYFNSKDSRIDIFITKTSKWNHLHFRDNGPGIEESKLKTIFDNFMTSGKKDGTGLGLPFCKRNIESFDGKIECFSKVGEGTEFVMSFPEI